MIRDPYKTAREAEIKKDSLLQKLVARVYARLPPEKQFIEKMLLMNNVTRPKNVIDAVVGVECSACGTACWVSPSSIGHLNDSTIICLQCLEKEAVVYEQERAREL